MRPWLRGSRAESSPPALHPVKLRAIDAAFQRADVRSFADLGGLWAVEGGYTFYALDTYPVQRALLVDTGVSAAVDARAAHFPALQVVRANFGDESTAARVGSVDAVLLFDVLLHQVDPDWDEVLRMYAAHTRCFVVVNPQYDAAEHTVRLLDLGREAYLANVPREQIAIDFDRLDEQHPTYGRPWRDIHEIWQWGITDLDLRGCLSDLGFELTFFEDTGPWQDLARFRNRAFVFVRP